jgi:geminin
LAEKRRLALEESLTENQELYERIASLEDELNQSKSMLAESKSLIEVLTEMLEEKDNENDEDNAPSTSEAAQPTSHQKDA